LRPGLLYICDPFGIEEGVVAPGVSGM